MMKSSEFAALLNIVDPEERLREYAQLDANITNLAVAENVLLYPFLREHVFEKLPVIGQGDIKYAPAHGSAEFRKELSELLKYTFGIDELNSDHIFGTAGVSAALESLAFALFDHTARSNKVLIPNPCWQGFKWCFEQRPPNGLVVNFPTENLTPQITVEQVHQAYQRNPDAKILLLTNPSNPLGINYNDTNLNNIYRYVLERTEMHIISDEIYASSQTADAKPKFVSALNLPAYKCASSKHKERVHVVWGFAKDFGLSGFKAGFIVSTSQRVRAYQVDKGRKWKGVSRFSPIDSLKHLVLLNLLQAKTKDGIPVWKQALKEYQSALTKSSEDTKTTLKRHRIKYFEDANAAQFLWLNLSEHLESQTLLEQSAQDDKDTLYPELSTREQCLEKRLREEAHVALLPGTVLANPKEGWFRLCFTAQPWQEVKQAIERIGEMFWSK